MPTLGDVVDLLARLVPARARRRLGRRRAGAAATRTHDGTPDPAGRRPGHRGGRRGGRRGTPTCCVTHHPLFLKRRARRRRDRPQGPHRCTGCSATGCALLTAHTNADRAGRRRLRGAGPRARPARRRARSQPTRRAPLDKIVVFAPVADAERSAPRWPRPAPGRIGDYDQASFTLAGRGTVPAARGRAPGDRRGRASSRSSTRSGSRRCCPRARAAAVVAAMLAAHPYEEPAYDVVELAAADGPRPWLGPDRRPAAADRRCASSPRTWPRCCRETAHGVRVAGDPDRVVQTVALCGGAGDFLLDRARAAGADVYLTCDLRHHPAVGVARARRPGAGRRGALGGRVDLAAGAAGAAGRGPGRYGGDPRQHD